MQSSPEQLDAILASMGEGLLVVDTKYQVILMNQAAGILLEIAPADAVGKDIKEIFHFYKEEGEELLPGNKLIERAIQDLNIIYIRIKDDYYCENKRGKRFSISLVITTLLVEEKITGAVIIFRDTSEEKAIDQAKSEFVSLASHQLRTPLATINWYTEILLDKDIGQVNPEQKECLEELYHASQRMVGLVDAFLNVARIELGTVAIDPQPVSIAAIVDDVLRDFLPQIQVKKLKLVKHYEQTLPRIKADPKLVRVILQNLISNAIKYTSLAGEIRVEVAKKNLDVLVKVADTGYGIPKNQQNKIFTKLFRADNVVEKDVDGNGLGLYIVKSIIEEAGGKIWFFSDQNKGTTFYIAIPLRGMRKKEGTKTLH